MVESGI